MKRVAVLFPGQGSQFVGMGASFYRHSEEFRRAMSVSGMQSLIANGPPEMLTRTENAQPAILATSIGIWRTIQNLPALKRVKIDYFMGHSLGEFSALVANNQLEYEEALDCVKERGLAMQESCDTSQDLGMAALLFRPELYQKVMQHLGNGDLPVEVSNFNSHSQIVLSGRKSALAALGQEMKKSKLILKSTVLDVSAPFHSSWMLKASEIMKPKLESLETITPSTPGSDVISNVTALPYPAFSQEIKAHLLMQIVSPVRWTQSIDYVREQGIRDWLCIGPGKALGLLLQRDFPEDRVHFVQEYEDVNHLQF